jgi:outer membrane protein TolC
MGMVIPPETVREKWTAQFSAILAQPISGLFVISRLIGLENAGVDAARNDLSTAKLDVTTQTAELYLRAMQAGAYVQIAEQTITQLEGQKKRAEALQATGVLGKVDLMRIDSARSQAQAQLLGARDRRAQAIDAVVLFMGLRPGTTLETVDDLPAELPPVAFSDEEGLRLAAEKRPELKAALARARQAEGGADVVRSDYFPNVNAFAQYTHTENAGLIAQEDDMFVGISLKWDVWDWGNRKADLAEARGKARQAKMAAKRLEDQLAVDVRNRIRTARTSGEAIGVAREGLATAEEAYRIVSLRYQSGDATTLDLLDVEAEVSRARLLAATARYDYAIALVQLARALGLPPLAALQNSAAATPKASR